MQTKVQKGPSSVLLQESLRMIKVAVTNKGGCHLPCKENSMFTTKNKAAIEFYKQACSAEEMGDLDLAEVYYVKSAYAFEQTGRADYLNAANAFNALAFLRESRGNHKGALCAAKKSAQIMENYRDQPATYDAELIRMTAWELINDLISFEIDSRTLISQAG